jgi:hypothetical protein
MPREVAERYDIRAEEQPIRNDELAEEESRE